MQDSTSFQQDEIEMFDWHTAKKLSISLDNCKNLPFSSSKAKPVVTIMKENNIKYKKLFKKVRIRLDTSLTFFHRRKCEVKKVSTFRALI